MKKIISILSTLCLFGLLSLSLNAQQQPASDAAKPATNQARTIKPHHQTAGLKCASCHGNGDITEYKMPVTKDCLACHGSAEKVAQRTAHLDAKHINPHRSIHDGTDLDCYECHAEHKPSSDLCAACHDNTNEWFKPTP